MIDLWPAIDLINSTSVRLTEGKYDSKEKMEKSVEDSIRFYSQFKCVKRIHIVDLIGAKAKEVKEFEHETRRMNKTRKKEIQLELCVVSSSSIINHLYRQIFGHQ